MNVQAFEELKRVLDTVPESEFSLNDWDRCACGHATRDPWFRRQGFTTCRDFYQAAAFFEIPRWKAEDLFSAPYRLVVTPSAAIKQIGHGSSNCPPPGRCHENKRADRRSSRQAVSQTSKVACAHC